MIRLLSIYFIFHSFCAFSATNFLPQNNFLTQNFPDYISRKSNCSDSLLNSMSQEQKIAQLFMVAAYSNVSEKENLRIANLVSKYEIGGLIFFQGTIKRQAELTNRYQKLSKIPLMIGMDAEYGLGARLKQTIRFPRQMMLGAIQDEKLIYELGKEMGLECRRLGVHVNFAPVVDVNNNPKNPVINARSFGENRINVTTKAYAIMKGLLASKVIAVAKHFPGHGDTDTDSHKQLPIVPFSRSRLDSLELFPFKHLIERGISGVMVGHLNVPALDVSSEASSLSSIVVDSLLKKEMGFKGLVFTDALNMRGVSKFYSPGKIDVKALVAGNDVLLFSLDVPKAIIEIKKAIADGLISQKEIDNRCLKILRAKEWLGLLKNYKPVSLNRLWSKLNTQKGISLRYELPESAITIIKNRKEILPIESLGKLKIASVAMGRNTRNRFQEYLSKYGKISEFQISKNASDAEYKLLKTKLDKYDLIIVSKHDSDRRPSRKFGVTNQTVKFLSDLSETKNVIFDLFANPYALNYYKNLDRLDAIIISYEDTRESQIASAQIIFGGISAKGILPVSINDTYTEGSGIRTKSNRLAFARPVDLGMNILKLNKIDSIVNDGIRKKAFPGCQVVVAKKGKLIFNRSYGHFTYNKKRKVRTNSIYDLASVTKISSTVLALMKLDSQNRVDIDKPMSDYLQILKNTNKESLSIREILSHQSGLLRWIPFFRETLDTLTYTSNLYSNKKSPLYSLKISRNLFMNNKAKLDKHIFSNTKKDNFNTKVATNLYIEDSYKDVMIKRIIDSDLQERGKYAYSDLGLILLKEMVESVIKMPIDEYVEDNFYKPIGAHNLCFHPLLRFKKENIVPTQNDKAFRKQLLKGYVHDPSAAMFGGVAGNAGLFGNALDLAKVMQLFLQNGTYGDTKFINSNVVEKYTCLAYPNSDNRRGIGFDKPYLERKNMEGPTCKEVSDASYGHTGYTGTMVWVDPKHDLVYVFLSNRVYPNDYNTKISRMDIRTKIQRMIYRSLMKENNSKGEFSPLEFSPIGEGVFY